MVAENESKIVIYQTPDGNTAIDVKMENDTVWLNTSQMAELFDRDEKTIRKHVNNVFSEGELVKENNTHFLRVDGVKQPVAYYALDVIISVGYRVKSVRGTQFRIWANKILKEYLVKGFAVNNKIAAQKYDELCKLVNLVGRGQTHCRQYARGDYADDCGKPPARKRHDGESCGKPHQ